MYVCKCYIIIIYMLKSEKYQRSTKQNSRKLNINKIYGNSNQEMLESNFLSSKILEIKKQMMSINQLNLKFNSERKSIINSQQKDRSDSILNSEKFKKVYNKQEQIKYKQKYYQLKETYLNEKDQYINTISKYHNLRNIVEAYFKNPLEIENINQLKSLFGTQNINQYLEFIFQLKEENTDLKSHIEKMLKICHMHDIEDMMREIADIYENNNRDRQTNLEIQINRLKLEKLEGQQHLKQSQDSVSQLQTQIKETKIELTNIKQKFKQLQESLRFKNHQYDILKSMMLKLKNDHIDQIKVTQTTKKQLETTISNHEIEINKLQKEIANIQVQNESKNKLISELKKCIINIEDQKDKLVRQCTVSHQKFEDLESKLQNQIENYENTINQMNKEKDFIKMQFQEKIQLKQEEISLRKENCRISHQQIIKAKDIQLHKYKQFVNKINISLKTQSFEQISSKIEHYINLEQQFNFLQIRHQQIKKNYQKQAKLNKDLKIKILEIEKLKNQQKNKNTRCIEEAEKIFKQGNKELLIQNQQLSKGLQQFRQLNIQLKINQKKLITQYKQLKAQYERLKSTQNEYNKLKLKISQYQQMIDCLSNQNNKHMTDLKVFETQNYELKSQIQKYENQEMREIQLLNSQSHQLYQRQAIHEEKKQEVIKILEEQNEQLIRKLAQLQKNNKEILQSNTTQLQNLKKQYQIKIVNLVTKHNQQLNEVKIKIKLQQQLFQKTKLMQKQYNTLKEVNDTNQQVYHQRETQLNKNLQIMYEKFRQKASEIQEMKNNFQTQNIQLSKLKIESSEINQKNLQLQTIIQGLEQEIEQAQKNEVARIKQILTYLLFDTNQNIERIQYWKEIDIYISQLKQKLNKAQISQIINPIKPEQSKSPTSSLAKQFNFNFEKKVENLRSEEKSIQKDQILQSLKKENLVLAQQLQSKIKKLSEAQNIHEKFIQSQGQLNRIIRDLHAKIQNLESNQNITVIKNLISKLLQIILSQQFSIPDNSYGQIENILKILINILQYDKKSTQDLLQKLSKKKKKSKINFFK